MHPVFSLFGVHVHAYALCTWIAAAAACALALPYLRRVGWSVRQSFLLPAAMCVCFLIGARLWNMAVNPANYLTLPWYSLKLAGLSLYGGLVGAIAALLVCTKAAGKKPLPVLDAMTVPGGAAFCIARLGCFLNGCCGGIATGGPFGVVFPSQDLSGNLPSILSFLRNRAVHPTQLYELFGAAVGLAAAAIADRRLHRTPGVRFLCYAGVFSLMRLLVLPLRALAYPAAVKNVLYPALYLCVMIASAAGIYLLKKHKAGDNERPGG